MEPGRRYDRQTVLLACLVTWLFGIGNGYLVGLMWARDARPADPLSATVSIPRQRPFNPRPSPSPSSDEFVMPAQWHLARSCPKTILREIRVRDGGDARSVAITLQLTNDSADRTCVLERRAAVLRDGDGHQYEHDGEDVSVGALGAKMATLRYSVPRTLDLVQLVLQDDDGRPRASDFELVPRQGAGR